MIRPRQMGEAMSEGVRLEESWKTALAGEFSSPYMAQLKDFLKAEKEAGKWIFPKALNISARWT